MNPLSLGRRAKPTKRHRPAIWENMLGTVYAMNDDRETKYFDYDYEAAIEYAGVTQDRDPRVAKPNVLKMKYRWTKGRRVDVEPPYHRPVLWITK